jgi:hypothetical protein
MSEYRAWETLCIGVTGIVLAKSRAQARYATIHAAREAGYRVAFTEKVRVRRAPDYDDLVPVCLPAVPKAPRALDLDYAARLHGSAKEDQ